MYPYPPPTTPAAEPPVDVDDGQGDDLELRPGELVKVTTFDTATLVDVDRIGLVVDVDAGAVRVAWLDDVSHPIALRPGESDRPDIPRVARLEV